MPLPQLEDGPSSCARRQCHASPLAGKLERPAYHSATYDSQIPFRPRLQRTQHSTAATRSPAGRLSLLHCYMYGRCTIRGASARVSPSLCVRGIPKEGSLPSHEQVPPRASASSDPQLTTSPPRPPPPMLMTCARTPASRIAGRPDQRRVARKRGQSHPPPPLPPLPLLLLLCQPGCSTCKDAIAAAAIIRCSAAAPSGATGAAGASLSVAPLPLLTPARTSVSAVQGAYASCLSRPKRSRQDAQAAATSRPDTMSGTS